MPDWFWYGVVFGYGAIVGSFLNVLIYRLPLGLSVAAPPSHCPRCQWPLGFWDNIPLLSFLALGARCRRCRAPIPWRYFGVELLTASLWLCLFHYLSRDTGISWVNFVAHALFASILVAVVFIDLDHFYIPDELNVVGMGIGAARDVVCLGLAWHAGPFTLKEYVPQFSSLGWLPRSLVGAAVYGGLLFLVSLLSFIYYARDEGESVAQVTRRFFVHEEAEPEGGGNAESAEASAPPPVPIDTVGSEKGSADAADDAEDEEPARLAFAPAFLAFVSALLFVPVVRGWAVFVFALPLLLFMALSRRPQESPLHAAGRFFRSDDSGAADALAGRAGDAPEDSLAAEADQFVREAETGIHGGMGLGDVKLALAIGALLGPGPALLSLFFATAAGATTGITLALLHGRGLRIGVPFGPFMALGAVLATLYGPALVNWYLGVTGLR